MVTCSVLEQYIDGLIILTGGPDGVIDLALRDGAGERARQMMERLMGMAPDHLYVELQRHGLKSENRLSHRLSNLHTICLCRLLRPINVISQLAMITRLMMR